MNKMKAWQGSYGVSRFDGIVSPAYFVFDLVGVGGQYFHVAIRSKAYIPFFAQASDGVRIGQWDLSQARMREIPFFIPPTPEQTAIVRFLDWAEWRIRRVIRARKRRIKLLEEYRQALINQAVTGKIDVRTGKPYPEYKDSGVEWLGEVPEHWEVVPLKSLALFKSGAGFPIGEQGGTEGDLPFFKVSDMNIPGNSKELRHWNNAVSRETAKRLGATIFPAGSILFPKVGGALLTNKRRIAIQPCCIDNNIMACIPRGDNSEFLFLLLSQVDLGKIAKPGPVPAISEGEVREIRVPLPIQEEQEAIVAFAERQSRLVEDAIAATRREIELLEEFRTRLVADVVTGKLDVREVAAKLPDELPEEETEPPDGEDIVENSRVAGETDSEAISEEALS